MAKILIVEDNQGTNKAICEYMKEAGHTLFSAFTGSEALKIFREKELDIIVLDIMLPEMSGIVVLHEIRKISNIPVIMLTALDDEYTQSNSFDEMADDYITKPFSMLILGKRITALLRRSQNKPAGVSAFANEGHDETDTQTLIETQHPVSSVLFRQDGADIQQSTDEGKTWQSYSPIEETDYFTYDEFSAWIDNETENIQKLVDAGEWTEAEATEALEYYDEILKSILEGKMVGKRASSSDDQLFFSMPDNAQPEQYQTFVFDGNTYKSIGPFDTEEELFNALKEYTDTEVEVGTMSQAEATALLEKYQ